jgi:hypothetical protein
VVECGRLESDYPFTGIEGSNPSLSSSLRQSALQRILASSGWRHFFKGVIGEDCPNVAEALRRRRRA